MSSQPPTPPFIISSAIPTSSDYNHLCDCLNAHATSLSQLTSRVDTLTESLITLLSRLDSSLVPSTAHTPVQREDLESPLPTNPLLRDDLDDGLESPILPSGSLPHPLPFPNPSSPSTVLPTSDPDNPILSYSYSPSTSTYSVILPVFGELVNILLPPTSSTFSTSNTIYTPCDPPTISSPFNLHKFMLLGDDLSSYYLKVARRWQVPVPIAEMFAPDLQRSFTTSKPFQSLSDSDAISAILLSHVMKPQTPDSLPSFWRTMSMKTPSMGDLHQYIEQFTRFTRLVTFYRHHGISIFLLPTAKSLLKLFRNGLLPRTHFTKWLSDDVLNAMVPTIQDVSPETYFKNYGTRISQDVSSSGCTAITSQALLLLEQYLSAQALIPPVVAPSDTSSSTRSSSNSGMSIPLSLPISPHPNHDTSFTDTNLSLHKYLSDGQVALATSKSFSTDCIYDTGCTNSIINHRSGLTRLHSQESSILGVGGSLCTSESGYILNSNISADFHPDLPFSLISLPQLVDDGYFFIGDSTNLSVIKSNPSLLRAIYSLLPSSSILVRTCRSPNGLYMGSLNELSSSYSRTTILPTPGFPARPVTSSPQPPSSTVPPPMSYTSITQATYRSGSLCDFVPWFVELFFWHNVDALCRVVQPGIHLGLNPLLTPAAMRKYYPYNHKAIVSSMSRVPGYRTAPTPTPTPSTPSPRTSPSHSTISGIPSTQSSFPPYTIIVDILGPFNNTQVPLGKTYSKCTSMVNFISLDHEIHFSFPTIRCDSVSLLWILQQFLASAQRTQNPVRNMVFDKQFDISAIREYLTINYPYMTFDFAPPGEHNKIAHVERLNRTIEDAMVRQLNGNPSIDTAAWGYMCIYYAFIRSLIPTQSQPDISPYERWYKKKFDFHTTPVLPFFTKVGAHIPANLQDKLGSHSRSTVYLGLSTFSKCAKLLDLDTKMQIDRRSFKVIQRNDTPSDKLTIESFISAHLPSDIFNPTHIMDHPAPSVTDVNYVTPQLQEVQLSLSDYELSTPVDNDIPLSTSDKLFRTLHGSPMKIQPSPPMTFDEIISEAIDLNATMSPIQRFSHTSTSVKSTKSSRHRSNDRNTRDYSNSNDKLSTSKILPHITAGTSSIDGGNTSSIDDGNTSSIIHGGNTSSIDGGNISSIDDGSTSPIIHGGNRTNPAPSPHSRAHIRKLKFQRDKVVKKANKLLNKIEYSHPYNTRQAAVKHRRNKFKNKMAMVAKHQHFQIQEKVQYLTDHFESKSLLVPRNINDINHHPDEHYDKWIEAITNELQSIKNNETFKDVSFDLSEISKHKIVPSQLVFDIRKNPDGTIAKFKCRLVARGDLQHMDTFSQTFADTVTTKSINMLFSIAAKLNMELESIDIKTAFLYSKMKEEIYLKRPPGLTDSDMPQYVRLNKCIYGLKQAAHEWRLTLHQQLSDLGFKQLPSDHCVYHKTSADHGKIILAIHVDDVFVAATSQDLINQFNTDIGRSFDISINNPMSKYLGMSIQRDRVANTIAISQPGYIESMIAKYPNLIGGIYPDTPMSATPYAKLKANDGSLLNETKKHEYMSKVGSLMYLAVHTRPDIGFSIGMCSRKLQNPSQNDMASVDRIMRYVYGTKELTLNFHGSPGVIELLATVDASFANHDDRKSHFGITMHLSPNDASFYSISKKSQCVALSSTEAEYLALCEASKLVAWARNFLDELGFTQNQPTTVFEDNKSTIYMVYNGNDKGKTKHIDIRYHYIREMIINNKIKVSYLNTEDMISDMLTKPLETKLFVKHRNNMLGNHDASLKIPILQGEYSRKDTMSNRVL